MLYLPPKTYGFLYHNDIVPYIIYLLYAEMNMVKLKNSLTRLPHLYC